MRRQGLPLVAAVCCLFGAELAQAQSGYSVPNYRAPTSSSIQQGVSRYYAPPAATSRYSARERVRTPTVSPWLNLLRNDGEPGTNYYTLVRPQLQQQAINAQVDRDIRSLRRDVLPQGNVPGANPNVRATGRTTTFMNLSRFYGQR